MNLSRREMLKSSGGALAAGLLPTGRPALQGADPDAAAPAVLPEGNRPAPVPLPHFPSRLHAFVWRNWELAPLERIAQTVDATPEQVRAVGRSMGLPDPPAITPDQWRRSYITVIRANWHLLPYSQLIALLGTSARELAYTLREDDFLYHKLGGHKPASAPLRYQRPTQEERGAAATIAQRLQEHFAGAWNGAATPRFDFVRELSTSVEPRRRTPRPAEGNEILLEGRWSVELPPSAPPLLAELAARFVRRLRATWGVAPALEPRPNGPRFVLALEPDRFDKPESHEIEVAADRIQLRAADVEGIHQGLLWLHAKFDEQNGPFLKPGAVRRNTRFFLRFLYSYFALYGDPLLDPALDPYPEGYLEKLSQVGVNGVWLQGVLHTLYPWKLAPDLSTGWEKRLETLRNLVARARRHGIGIYLYMNEPRAMPLAFFAKYPELKGVVEGEFAARCTSTPQVQAFLRDGLTHLFTHVPDLAGVFTISASENLTSCHSHFRGEQCPRCAHRSPAEVIAEVNRLVFDGARKAQPKARLIVWDWGWKSEWAAQAIALLPKGVILQSVSEWDLPIERGGIKTIASEYSISCVGPGPRARRHWQAAKQAGLAISAKTQMNNTWENSAIPFLPALDLVNQHLQGLARAGVDALQLSWTLGGYPSPNLELASQYYFQTEPDGGDPLERVAARRYGPAAGVVRKAWSRCSQAFGEFPYHIGTVYQAPLQAGPSNLLYGTKTGYRATMVGIPYDHVDGWRSVYPPEIFAGQLEKVAAGWKEAAALLDSALGQSDGPQRDELASLQRVMEAGYLHFQSVAQQVRFVLVRDQLAQERDAEKRKPLLAQAHRLLDAELAAARRLFDVVCRDSRIGFEATNHYYYTRMDLAEKVINCLYLKTQLLA